MTFDVEAAFDAAFEDAEPAEFAEQGALLDAEERNGGEPEPARTVNVHFEEEADLREFEEAVRERLYLTTESFWYAPNGHLDAPVPLAGENGMEFGPDPDVDAVARKVLEEAEELRWNPRDHGEMADVILAVARLADACDVDLGAALEVRHGRNLESDWERTEDGRMTRVTDR